MNVLLTGGSGFVGRRLIDCLLARGDRVTAIVRETSQARQPLAAGGLRVQVHNGTTARMLDIVAAEQPDVVVHLAARFLVHHTPADIDSLVDGNIRFGLQLLDAMRAAGVRRLVSAGTFWQHFESDGYRPVNLYAATKQAFENLVAYYVDAEGLVASHLRLYDVYGPGDERPKLIQYLLECARSGQPLDMSPGEQLLDLVHVDDAVAAFARALDRQVSGEADGNEVFAVSSASLISLRELVRVMGEVAGRPLPVNFGGRPYRPREVMRPWRGGIPVPGWEPRVALHDGLRELLASCV